MTTMKHNGLAKLSEELGEFQQIIGKMLQFPELQHDDISEHPSGYNLRRRMEEEMGDVLAAMRFVHETLRLEENTTAERKMYKLTMFRSWGVE